MPKLPKKTKIIKVFWLKKTFPWISKHAIFVISLRIWTVPSSENPQIFPKSNY